jgi:cell division transport system permease protein
LLFIIKESLKLISRAKFSFILSLISTSISVILIIASLFLLVLSDRLESRIKKNISINIFLEEDVSPKDISSIEKQLQETQYISSVIYIDKEKAAENFINETGEDFRKLLDYNPLPASFRIYLKEHYADSDSISIAINFLSEIDGVEEVVYQHQFINKMLSQLNSVKQYIFVITVALVLISIYIVYSTMQLIINSKYEELDTMKLVGAKISTIKMPIILNGIFIGFFAGVIALGIFYFLFHYFELFLGSFGITNLYKPYYLPVIICIGPALAILVSIVSLRKVSLKI